MDPEIKELKEEVKRLTQTVQDTNSTVHKMRSAQRRQLIYRILWWLTILGVTGYTYLTFVQPYVAAVMETYGNAQDFQVQIQDWFAQFGNRGE